MRCIDSDNCEHCWGKWKYSHWASASIQAYKKRCKKCGLIEFKLFSPK